MLLVTKFRFIFEISSSVKEECMIFFKVIKRGHELRKETEKLNTAKEVGVAGLWDGVTLGQLVREPERAHVH